MFNRNLNLTLETVKNYKELNFENYEENCFYQEIKEFKDF